jgi:hypothetical protein
MHHGTSSPRERLNHIRSQSVFVKPCGCLCFHGDAAPFIGAIVSAGGGMLAFAIIARPSTSPDRDPRVSFSNTL